MEINHPLWGTPIPGKPRISAMYVYIYILMSPNEASSTCLWDCLFLLNMFFVGGTCGVFNLPPCLFTWKTLRFPCCFSGKLDWFFIACLGIARDSLDMMLNCFAYVAMVNEMVDTWLKLSLSSHWLLFPSAERLLQLDNVQDLCWLLVV